MYIYIYILFYFIYYFILYQVYLFSLPFFPQTSLTLLTVCRWLVWLARWPILCSVLSSSDSIAIPPPYYAGCWRCSHRVPLHRDWMPPSCSTSRELVSSFNKKENSLWPYCR